MRWSLAIILALSGVWWLMAPRADQPLVDAAEAAWPALRQLYLSEIEAGTYDDARRYDERYRLEAERLNELETRNRAEGARLDDTTIRRISSFLKSYGEMRKGEQFVMGEVRARARERWRWVAGALLLLAAAALMPGAATRVTRLIRQYVAK